MASQTIKIKNSNVVGKVPAADQLATAELVINLKDKKLFSKDADGTVFEISGGGGGGDVESVNGKTGKVVLTASDVGALPDDTDLNFVPMGSWAAIGELV